MATESRALKERTLTYRRAIWHQPEEHHLQYYVQRIHERLRTTADRTFAYSGKELVGLSHGNRRGVTLGHIGVFARDESTSTIPHPSRDVASSDAAELPPPRGSQFLDGDITFLVSGNHLLLCPSGARESVVKSYLEMASERIGSSSLLARCSIEPVADMSKVRLIQEEGVKKIRLDASLYQATLLHEEARVNRPTVITTVLSNVGGGILDLFRQDPSLPEIAEQENITVRLEISFDGRRRGGEIGQARMQGMAERLVEEDDSGFRIVTGSGALIEPKELKIRRALPLTPLGNSVSREHAWAALVEFYEELRAAGALET